ncbi:MAG: hypothetical protein ABFC56_06675 [Clostridiaceae bacterium]
MKSILLLAIAAIASTTLVSCLEKPVGYLTVPIYKSDVEKIQQQQPAQ